VARSGPQSIGDVLAELMARKNFGRVRGAAAFETAWREAAGAMAAEYTRVGALRGGKLEVTVANSALVQELTFQKPELLKALRERLPEEKIRDLRFRVGVVS
jgi:predicted nucleic acid-binding Zn ribbon protein